MNDRRSSVRFTLAIFLALVVAAAGAWRIYRQVIPAGAPPFDILFDPVPGPTLTSPDGRRVVDVVYYPRGAAQSGNYLTAPVVENWLTGRSVIAKGFRSSADFDRSVPFPARWLDGQTLEVGFVERYGKRPVPAIVRLK